MKKAYKRIGFFCVIIVVVVGIIIYELIKEYGLLNNDCIERQSTYKVTHNGAMIIAFNSIPKEVIISLKDYIMDNGYNGEGIRFVFENSLYYCPTEYSLHNDVFYVYQEKCNTGKIDYKYNRGSVYIGNMVIDKDGNVIETHNLIPYNDLSKLQMEPNISFKEALQMARDYLSFDENSSVEIWSWRFCTPHNDDEWVLCFMIKFKDVEEAVYIDGFSGQIIE